MKIAIINGPNLNLLGSREPSVYGAHSFESYLETLHTKFPSIQFTYFQSNVEGELINAVQQADADGIILNAGAYTHTSIALADAIRAIQPCHVIEVHISNVFAREEYRHQSYLAGVCLGVITGFGLNSYTLAVEALLLR